MSCPDFFFKPFRYISFRQFEKYGVITFHFTLRLHFPRVYWSICSSICLSIHSFTHPSISMFKPQTVLYKMSSEPIGELCFHTAIIIIVTTVVSNSFATLMNVLVCLWYVISIYQPHQNQVKNEKKANILNFHSKKHKIFKMLVYVLV